jgi:uncharacterized protein (DUF302 family)
VNEAACLDKELMMKKTIFFTIVFLLLTISSIVHADTGLINIQSKFDVIKTADRFTAAVLEAGLKVFNRVDHAAGALKTGETLRPTQLIIFGSPALGTALLTSDQRVGIDLPLKALVWQDAEGRVWLSYNSPDYVLDRFAIKDRPEVKVKVSSALEKLAQHATQP